MSDCVFCRIVAGELPARVRASSPDALAFDDIAPQAPVHVLIVPKAHHRDVPGMTAADPGLAAELIGLAAEVAAATGIAEPGYRLIANTGPGGGQTVFHAHLHLLGGTRLNWPG
ncbi:histidine triad nucleotide-binding protein [Crossiella cryophila]|uniref:Histidine triad (HIT) family protein n=1 Tax=Crossiella cryophila TaxID=43355 RepID=A0A7W7FRV2_9PSEU|nr:histidine triad nucleotide-binding protein [Crossiella cryophila]MBB4676401.1 histidine triad (HIT) family protein [Crossiella cryophila]